MKNVLLLAMSTLPKNIDKPDYYQYENADGEVEVIEAISQLEPITHMLSKELRKKGEKLDKIIILETEKTLEADDEKPSAVAFYKERVARFAGEAKYIDILIDENDPAEGIRQAIDEILRESEELDKNENGMKLWIDTQGGFRDVVMVFTAIISLLREQGIEAEGIYAIRYAPRSNKAETEAEAEKKQNPHPIINQTEKYRIFKFVSAMQEFMDFGKATGLKAYYGEEDSFVQAIGRIADSIQMCQPQMFEEALRGFAAYLQSEQYKNDKRKDQYIQIFDDFIKKDYGVLLEKPDDTIEQIKWCVHKEFYQQAMTIYTEKIPGYYAEKGILNLKVDSGQKSSYGKNPYADAFYTDLYDDMLTDEKDGQLNDLLTKMKEYEKVNELDCAVRYLQSQQAQGELDPAVQMAVNTLIGRLQNGFDSSGKRKGKSKGTKTIQQYIINYCDAQGKGNRAELLGEKGKYSTVKGYEKKVRAIEAAKNKNPELVKLMEYYLAIKLLRNQMNHASGEKGEEGKQEAAAFLKAEGIDIGMEIVQDELRLDYTKIKKLITDGLDCFH